MCRARGAGDSRSRIILMFNLVTKNEILSAKKELLRSVARLRGLGNSCALLPGLTPRALCYRALRALSHTFQAG
jgi:hypothetical protein